jgi:glycosyltransferase involved in cell wall biosynthesis
VTYLGIMGPQDGVEHALRAAEIIIHQFGRNVGFLFMGDGDSGPSLRQLAADLQLTENVIFTGMVDGRELLRNLSASDVCVCPEPANGLNEYLTTIKAMEYMAMGKPIVAYDLQETRFSAGDAALYATPNDVHDFAMKILELLDDPARRDRMGRVGRQRVRNELAWRYSRARLLEAYDHVLADSTAPVRNSRSVN